MSSQGLLWSNFSKPQGFVGELIGNYMAFENYVLNLWAVYMMEIQEKERILEVGFGPGIAIQEMAKQAKKGFIAGVDYSALMVSKAQERNHQSIQEGKVDLRQATANQLPEYGEAFDKVLTVNNIMYWERPIETLYDLRNQLKQGGQISVVFQRCCVNCIQNGHHHAEINWYMHCLFQAGFRNIQVRTETIQKQNNQSFLRKAINYLQGIRPVKLPINSYCQFSENTIGGICIRATNPTVEMIIEEFLNLPRAFMLSRHIPVRLSVGLE